MSQKIKSLALLFSGLAILFALPFFGTETISMSDVLNFSNLAPIDHKIFWSLRIPRLILVVGAGGSLAVIGATYQTIFNNKLADPYILGVSSAVTLGVVLGNTILKFSTNQIQSQIVGLFFALLVVLLLLSCYLFKWGKELERVVLFGMGLNFVFSSLLFFVMSYQSQSIGTGSLRWLFGHIPWTNLNQSLLFFVANLIFLGVLWILGRFVDGLGLGDAVAHTLGFSPTKVRAVLLLITSLQLTLITSVTGAVGFLGLVIPHCVRLLFYPSSSRSLFISSFLSGAIFLAISDTLSRTLYPPLEFPVGIITTLIGGPIFLFLLWKK